MQRGYRYSSAVALANYYADVRNYANFRIADPAEALAELPGRTYGNAPQAMLVNRSGSAARRMRLSDRVSAAGAGAAKWAGANKRRLMVGGGVAAGLGAAGLGASYLMGRRGAAAPVEEEASPSYAAYDPRRYLGG